MLRLSSVFFLIAFIGCVQNSSENDGRIELSDKQLTFTTSFPSFNLQVYEKEGECYLTFADFVTYDKIEEFNLSGRKLSVIDLSLLPQKGSQYMTYMHTDNRSILLLRKYSSRLDYINWKGEIINSIDFSDLGVGGLELSSPLISTPEGRVMCSLSAFKSDTMITDELYSPWGKHAHKLPIVASFSNDENGLKFHGKNFISRFASHEERVLGGLGLSTGKDGVYVVSSYVDTIYKLKGDDFLPITTIQSVKGKITIDKILEKELLNIDLNSVFTNNYYLSSLLYDKYRQLYYLFIRHPKVENNRFKHQMIIYDDNWKKLIETTLPENYYPSGSFVNKDGLYVLVDFEENPFVKKFNLVTYEK